MSEYRTQALDTSREIEEVQLQAWRAMPSWEKIEQIRDLIRFCFGLSLLNIRKEFPNATGRELWLKLAERNWDDRKLIEEAARRRPEEGTDVAADFVEAILRIAEILEDLEIPYFVGGSVASSVFGESRSTRDVDLVADIRKEHVEPLLRALKEDFYVPEGILREGVRDRTSFSLMYLPKAFKVDVFLVKGTPFDLKQMLRRRFEPIDKMESRTVPLSSPEDIVLTKLDWYRKGHEVSTFQWRDILGVLKVQKEKVDLNYLRRTAAQLDLKELLDRALRESGLS